MFNQNIFFKNTPIHRFNPILKFTSFIFFIVMIFLPLGFFAQIILLIVTLTIFFLAKIRLKTFWNILKSVLILFSIMFLINWIMYKNPIGVNISNFNLIIGSPSWVNGPIAYHTENVYISNLWGGAIGINNNVFLEQQQNIFSQIMMQNHVSNASLDNLWLTNSKDNDLILSLFNNDLTLAKQYKWLMVESGFIYNNESYVVTLVDNFDPSTIAQRYYVYKSTWYALSPLAIQLALFISIKVFLMIIISTILTETTNSQQLTYALEILMSPLRLFRLPTAEGAMIIAIALRFIPSLIAESGRIQNAQAARGIDAKNGGIKDKTKSVISLIIPLFSIAFKKSDELANAMESRAYNPRYARTKYRSYTINWSDWLFYSLLCLLLGFFIIITAYPTFFTPLGIFEANALS